jgi:hypothetical protein
MHLFDEGVEKNKVKHTTAATLRKSKKTQNISHALVAAGFSLRPTAKQAQAKACGYRCQNMTIH